MHRLLGSEKLIVGFDLGNESSQISYCRVGDDNVESLSQIAGVEDYDIPTVLCKRVGVNQWFYGKEALRYEKEHGGILVPDLLDIAIAGETVVIDERPYDPIALLTLFMKRCLGTLSQVATSEKIEAIMFTCDKLDRRVLEILESVCGGLKLKAEQVFFQSHTESFYNYMIHQPSELWNYQVMMFQYCDGYIKAFQMDCNKRTTPIVVFINESQYSFINYEPMPEEEILRQDKMNRLDSAFLDLVTKACGDELISSVFLVGEHFDQEWMKDSLKYLCRGKRVFQGNNLFCKGACYGMLERLSQSDAGAKHVFLGNEKLKANVGMKLMRRGVRSYYAILDAGINWFEAERTMECYVQDGNEIELVITPLIGGQPHTEKVILGDIPGDISRIQLSFRMKEENVMTVEATDLGLSEIRHGTGLLIRSDIELF